MANTYFNTGTIQQGDFTYDTNQAEVDLGNLLPSRVKLSTLDDSTGVKIITNTITLTNRNNTVYVITPATGLPAFFDVYNNATDSAGNPIGVNFVAGSFTVNGAPAVPTSIDNGTLTYNTLPPIPPTIAGGLAGKLTITFQVQIVE